MTIDNLSLPPTPSDVRTKQALERIRSKLNELVDNANIVQVGDTGGTVNQAANADTVDGYHHDQSLLKAATPTFAAVKTNAINVFSRTIQSVVTFSFDDGQDSVLTLGKPVFDAHAVAATLFIVTDWIGTEGKLTTANLATLFAAGWEIASHTKTHADLALATPEELTTELATSQSVLRGLGYPCRTLAYPYGSTNVTVRNAVKQYYELARRAWGWGGVDWQPLPLTSFRLSAIGLDGLSLAAAKAYVDAAVGTTMMLNFFGHQVNAAMATLLDDLITYIESKGIAIVTYEDAIPIVGNVFEYESSDEADRFTVGADGRLGIENLDITALTADTVCAGCAINFRSVITGRSTASLELNSGQIMCEDLTDPAKRLVFARFGDPNISVIQSWWTSGPTGCFWPLCLNPEGGNVGIGTFTPGSALSVVGLPTYATDALAGTGGLVTGDLYTVTGTSPLQLAVKI